ncbi:MAG: RNA pyrophosphohydrolase [Rhodospirillales bacterium CG15_BIG_FIL_POST_REV_8_21_14_020_66_15]|nr:MAG: RNA pyrophosphohydrolase [Rhodospirillales bacterium CG15_BIG_FIL_POST_REV_8_21_14_020_66_15]
MTDIDDDPRPFRTGVGALLLNSAGRVWVGERIRRTAQQLEYPWQLPQGGLDAGEDPRDAVFRELEEETGTANAEIIAETPGWLTYDLPIEVRDRVWSGRFRGQRQKWYALRFLGRDEEFDLNTHHQPEFSSWRWAPMAELPSLVVPFKRGLYHDLLAAFAHLDDDAGGPVR